MLGLVDGPCRALSSSGVSSSSSSSSSSRQLLCLPELSSIRRRPGAFQRHKQQQKQEHRSLVPHSAGLASAPANEVPDTLTCPHPDAIRRRKEREARQKQAGTERRRSQMMENMGLKWFEGHQPMNMTNCKNADDYRAIVKQAQAEGKLLVTKFFTEDCYVCKSLYPKMKRIASDNPDVLWAKLNGTDATLVPIFQAMGIKKVPYFHMVFDGQLVSEMSVSLSTEKLSKFRAELAAHKRSQSMSSPPPATEPATATAAEQQQDLFSSGRA